MGAGGGREEVMEQSGQGRRDRGEGRGVSSGGQVCD